MDASANEDQTIKSIFKNLDVIAGIIGIFLGAFIILLYYAINLRQQDIGFTILIASSIYLLLRNKFKKTTFTALKTNYRIRLFSNIIFFTIFPITLLIWHTHLYFRPLSYFILISVLVSTIAVEILYFEEGNPVWPTLLKIFLLSVSIRAGIFYNFPSLVGADAFWHAKIADLISNTGFVPPLEVSRIYFYYPINHIFLSITQIVCQTDIKDAIFLSIGLVSTASTVFVYYMAKKFAGPRVGLLATLLVNITNFIIFRGIKNVTPGSLVLCWFMLILYLLFKEEHKFTSTLLIIFIGFLTIITHQLSTFVVFISLASISLIRGIHRIVYRTKENSNITMIYILLFAVAMYSYWMYTYVGPGQTFFDFVVGPLIRTLRSGIEISSIRITGSAYDSSPLDTLLLHMPYLILPFFVIGGALLWVSSKDNKKFSIVTTVAVLYMFIYVIPLFNIGNMISSRWQPFLSVFLVILASVYILKVTALIRFNPAKIFAMSTIIFIFSFFMVTTQGINKDNLLWAKNRTSRDQFKDSEIDAIMTINNIYNGRIRTDSSYASGLFRQMRIKTTVERFDVDYITSSAKEEDGTMIILRKCALKEPVSIIDKKSDLGERVQLLSKEFFDRFASNDYDCVYNNAEVLGYVLREQ